MRTLGLTQSLDVVPISPEYRAIKSRVKLLLGDQTLHPPAPPVRSCSNYINQRCSGCDSYIISPPFSVSTRLSYLLLLCARVIQLRMSFRSLIRPVGSCGDTGTFSCRAALSPPYYTSVLVSYSLRHRVQWSCQIPVYL